MPYMQGKVCLKYLKYISWVEFPRRKKKIFTSIREVRRNPEAFQDFANMTVCHASDRSDEQESQGKKGKVVSPKQVFAKKKINPLSEIGGSKHCRGKGEHVYRAWTTRRVTKRAGVSVPVVTAGK